MHAIILAAGRGSRLAEHNPEGKPKCLLELGGRSLLARHLDLLYLNGVRQVDLVIGYEADQIIEHIGQLRSRPDVAFHFNPRYLQGSVISLLCAAETLKAGDDVVIMDADVLYHPAILERLLRSPHANCFLLDRDFVPGDEPVKIAVHDGLMVEFRKQLKPGLEYDQLGESVGFFKFDADMAARIADECLRHEREGLADAPHEEALRNILLSDTQQCSFEDVSGLPWVEIDFPADVLRARDEILPAIRREHANF